MARSRLYLPDVTLCAVSGILVEQTIAALRHCLDEADFAEVILITDQRSCPVPVPIRSILVDDIRSRDRYSQLVLTELAQHVRSDFVLLVQWDGYITRPENWTDEFLRFDYIGAPWPQFPTERSVGNGGFSLRSRRLLMACEDRRFKAEHPEDLCICHHNRQFLEAEHGLVFAPPDLAARFSYERCGDARKSFGFHGLFNMPYEMGMDRFLNFFERIDQTQLGLGELMDVREILHQGNSIHERGVARKIFWNALVRHWNSPVFWKRAIAHGYPDHES